MDIQYLVQNYSGAIALLFQTYGINTPVNYDTLSAAITLHSTANGNAFLSDLMSVVGNGYDDYDEYEEILGKKILGLGKKGKARRQEKRAARGGFSRIGAIARKIGIAKNKPAKGMGGEAEVNAPGSNAISDQANDNPKDEPKNKITLDGVLDGAGKVAGAATGIIGAIQGITGGGGGGGSDDGGGGGDDGGNDTKKAFPWMWVGIGAGALAIIGIIIAVVKSSGKKS